MKKEFSRSCDVLVCGGGIAGIAAALAAAREKKNVILLERSFMLGGLATAGLITVYLPLCDGMGNQVSFGIAEELLRLSVKHGCERGCDASEWLNGNETKKDRFLTRFNAQFFALEAERLLLKEGVKILYGVFVSDVETKDNKITACITEGKSGRCRINVKSVVDATGDADVAHFSDAECDTFKQGNILAAWYYSDSKSDNYTCRPLGVCDIPDDQKTKDNEVPVLMNRRFAGLEDDEISEFVALSHLSTLNDIAAKRKDDASYVPATLATIPQLRMTRKIVGEYVLDDKEDHKYFEDSIGMVSDWRKNGPVYEVPFTTLYSRKCKNLVCAGRCTSVTEAMWDIMRVIPCCAVTGQAAGCAAAISDDFTKLDIKELQAHLTSSGVVLHWDDIKK